MPSPRPARTQSLKTKSAAYEIRNLVTFFNPTSINPALGEEILARPTGKLLILHNIYVESSWLAATPGWVSTNALVVDLYGTNDPTEAVYNNIVYTPVGPVTRSEFAFGIGLPIVDSLGRSAPLKGALYSDGRPYDGFKYATITLLYELIDDNNNDV